MRIDQRLDPLAFRVVEFADLRYADFHESTLVGPSVQTFPSFPSPSTAEGQGEGEKGILYFAKIFLNSAPHFLISSSESSRIGMTLALSIPAMGG